VQRILTLAGPGGKYHDLNVCHLHELLQSKEDIAIGRSTLDRMLKQAGLRQPARSRRRGHRQRRTRRAAEGMLLQIDGSPHHWFGKDYPACCLMAAIDDATGKVLAAFFCPTETSWAYLKLLEQVVVCWGARQRLSGSPWHSEAQ
jgi:hypothetical protein